MQHIALLSYGKDSMKMLDVIATRGLPLDRIVTSDVWATDTIPASLPPVTAFKEEMDGFILERYGINVEHLWAVDVNGNKQTYEKLFYHIPKRRERERESWTPTQGNICGYPTLFAPWCQTQLKHCNHQGVPACQGELVQTSQNRYTDSQYQSDGEIGVRNSNGGFSSSTATRCCKKVVEYLGISADEPKRFGQLNEFTRAPLVEFGIEESLCGLYCTYAGCLSPTYETSCRDGCWFCHNQGVQQLRLLRKQYPKYWALLPKWDIDSPVTFKPDGHTVHDFDRRFQLEDEGFISTDDKVFRWDMLERELNYRLF